VKKEVRNEKRAGEREEKEAITNKNEGIVVAGEKRKHATVADSNDVEELNEMLAGCHSRGKKQRIRKKIQEIKNPKLVNAAGEEKVDTKKVDPEQKSVNAKDRVQNLLKARDIKLERKERSKAS